MDLGLNGKRAVVTGGSRGIGYAVARALRAEGAACLISARGAEALEAAAGELGCIACRADAATETGQAALSAAVDEHFDGVLDGLVCHVGSGRSVPPGEETLSEWRRMLDLNLLSTAGTVISLADKIRAGGAIVCVSSIAARLAGGAPVAYAAAKSGVEAMVAHLAMPLGRRGIRIVGVAPGNVLFPGSVWDDRMRDRPDEVAAMLDTQVPLNRLGHPEEIADLVTFLISPRASFITGSVHLADGGQARGR